MRNEKPDLYIGVMVHLSPNLIVAKEIGVSVGEREGFDRGYNSVMMSLELWSGVQIFLTDIARVTSDIDTLAVAIADLG